MEWLLHNTLIIYSSPGLCSALGKSHVSKEILQPRKEYECMELGLVQTTHDLCLVKEPNRDKTSHFIQAAVSCIQYIHYCKTYGLYELEAADQEHGQVAVR